MTCRSKLQGKYYTSLEHELRSQLSAVADVAGFVVFYSMEALTFTTLVNIYNFEMPFLPGIMHFFKLFFSNKIAFNVFLQSNSMT